MGNETLLAGLAASLGLFAAASVALMWSLRPNPVATRMLRYAGIGPTAPVRAARAPRLPRALEGLLSRCGVEWTPMMALLVLVAHGVGGAAVGLLLGSMPAGVVASYALLAARLRMGAGRRSRLLAEQLPEALMLMATTIRSGLGFQQALQLAARELPQPLAAEFGQLERDMALGLAIEEALGRFQDRVGGTDGEMLAAALLVQRQTGGNLSELLLNLHDTIRDRQAVAGQVRTLTAQGRMSGIVLTLIPVAIAAALYALNRPYLMMLIDDPRGRMLGGVALVLMIAGSLVIRRIVTITF